MFSMSNTIPAMPSGDRYVFCRLVAPRSTFALDLTPEERAAMQRHAAYWTSLLERGTAIVFGPVADPAGAWGLGILRLREGESLDTFIGADPAIQAGIGLRYETLPMLKAVAREG
jgi:YCII-related domain